MGYSEVWSRETGRCPPFVGQAPLFLCRTVFLGKAGVHLRSQAVKRAAKNRATISVPSEVADSEVTILGTDQEQPQILHSVQDDSAVGE